VRRTPVALARARRELADQIEIARFGQFLLFFAIAPLQDLLNLGNEARMNVPGGAEGNWRWRCTDDMLSPPAFEWLRDLTNMSGRSQGES
jgi:4-alpha-glucanotransferase